LAPGLILIGAAAAIGPTSGFTAAALLDQLTALMTINFSGKIIT
jgi:hypothetical protein